MNRKPYLDKICNNSHMPFESGGSDFNSVTHFPSLKHTGIRTQYEKEEMAASDPEGKLTRTYRLAAVERMCPILQDDLQLKGREAVFRRGHKQFLDKVLLDMEAKKHDQNQRRMQHWRGSKAKLGFSSEFSLDGAALSEALAAANSNYNDAVDGRPLSPDGKMVRFTASTAPTSPVGRQFSQSRRQSRPYNRLALFEELMKTTEAPRPATGVPRFGSITMPSSC